MTDACRRRGCGHGYGAHDRLGTRDACDVCACHAFSPDLRVPLRIAAAAAVVVLLVIYLGLTTGAHHL